MSRDFTGMTDDKECNCELCFRPSEGDFCQLCFSIINSQQKVGINMLMHPDQIKDGLKLIPKKFKSNKNSWDFLAKQVSDTDDVNGQENMEKATSILNLMLRNFRILFPNLRKEQSSQGFS